MDIQRHCCFCLKDIPPGARKISDPNVGIPICIQCAHSIARNLEETKSKEPANA